MNPADRKDTRMPRSDHVPLSVAATGLGCVRGGRRVFAGVSFRIDSGQLLAVAGPNGAGKSSLLRIVAGLLEPESGSVTVTGRGEGDDAFAHYLGHADALKAPLTVRETLSFWTTIYEARRVGDTAIEEAADEVGLLHALDLPVGVLSAGQRRRVSLARLSLSSRPLWLLDEPAASLDSEGETVLGRLMRDHLERGGLIIAAIHKELPIAASNVLDLGRAA
jgi:heme exporter protein A